MIDQHLIFLSYATPDRDRVFEYYDFLKGKGFQVWMDQRNIVGGQNWDFEIKFALGKASIIVVFISHNSVDRRGYIQREIKKALDQANDKLVDDIYIIPVMLDPDVERPTELSAIQFIQADACDPMQALTEALQVQFERLGAEVERIQDESDIRWSMTTHKDEWDGLPGYSISYMLPRLSSEAHPKISEITDLVRGWLVEQSMAERAVVFEQDSSFYNFGQNKFRRLNTWDASCRGPQIVDRMLSLPFVIWYYGAGAMHHNMTYKTFNFVIDPVIQIKDAKTLFSEKEKLALKDLQMRVREKLMSLEFPEMNAGDSVLKHDESWVNSGTENWGDFDNYVFGEHGMDFLFPPYQVGAYAFGPQSVTVSYDHIVPFMNHEYACALGIEYLKNEKLLPMSEDLRSV